MNKKLNTDPQSNDDVLRIEDLNIDFVTDAGAVPAVRGVDLSVKPGRSWPSLANPDPVNR